MPDLQPLAAPGVFPIAGLIIGLAVGSFLNVVAYRLPKILEARWRAECAELRGEPATGEAGLGLAFPGSRCPACSAPIRAIDNIPVLSYVWLRGRCRACGSRISARYPIVEAFSGAATAFLAWRYGPGLQFVGACGLVWSLTALALIDLDTQLLPDVITLPLVWAGLLLNLGGTFAGLERAVIGAAAGYLSLWSVFWLFKLATGKDGMGYGDFKLAAAAGAWLGWQMLPVVIMFASVVGAVVGIGLMVLARHGRDIPIPFGPYLAAGTVVALLWGEPIARFYLERV